MSEAAPDRPGRHLDRPGARAKPGRERDTPPFRYDAALANDIELTWQDRWEADGTFDSPNPTGPLSAGFERMAGRPKFYVLDMFPYPSGAGIHVGHPAGYVATDAYARYLRMTGYHVLHTMGYDAFGLPTEQFAISTGQHPRVATRQNIDNMRRQLRRFGLGHDNRRSIETTDPRYYRWTQWIFLKIFDSWVDERTGRARPIADLVAEFASGQRLTSDGRPWNSLTATEQREVVDAHRLAYVSSEPVNWCPGLGTVLANEEVTDDGRSDIGNYPVYRRPLRQWTMRITAMAQRLIDDLDSLEWPEHVKQLQRNWIGRSDGAVVWLPVTGSQHNRVEVFTTRPDTLAGATYVVVAPEHPQVDSLVPEAWPPGTPQRWCGTDGAERPRDAVAAYREATARLSDRQRTAGRPKSGVFTGSYVTNPAIAEAIPVFIADYVLLDYGTGAIMAVPAHDQRDLDFAREFDLPVRAVIEPPPSWLAARGIDSQTPAGQWPEAFEGDGVHVQAPGPDLAGLDARGGIDASIFWLERGGYGQAARRYRLRDWLFSRQRYWGEPIPIVYDDVGLPIALPEHYLPLTLPEVTEVRPDREQGDGSEPLPPLARVAEWATAKLDLGDGLRTYRREVNTMPQWAGSCWYYLRYLDPGNDWALADPQIERYWMQPSGVDLYVGGVEQAVLHLLYARFWHKVLYDLGLVSTNEPFARLVNQGMVLADAFVDARGRYVPAAGVVTAPDGSVSYDGQPVTRRAGKMGKSLKNGVGPDEMFQRYGADTLRLYELAMGPLEADRPWRTSDVVGVYRFLQRLWRCMIDQQSGRLTVTGAGLDAAAERTLHATIATVRRDFGLLRFNTAIARLIELTALAARVSARDGGLPRALAEPLVLMVAPMAPHIAEELWSRLGHAESLVYAEFPQANEELAREQTVTVPVQINGRTRFTVSVPADAGIEEIERMLTGHPDYAEHTAGLVVERLVVVPGRIVNVVVGQQGSGSARNSLAGAED